MGLVYELTGRLNSLVRELATAVSTLKLPFYDVKCTGCVWDKGSISMIRESWAFVHLLGLKVRIIFLLLQNFSEVATDLRQIFTEGEPPTLPQEHLNDPSFIALWFKVKLLPLLPAVPVHILSCLSTKNFTCPVFHTMWVHVYGQHVQVCSEIVVKRSLLHASRFVQCGSPQPSHVCYEGRSDVQPQHLQILNLSAFMAPQRVWWAKADLSCQLGFLLSCTLSTSKSNLAFQTPGVCRRPITVQNGCWTTSVSSRALLQWLTFTGSIQTSQG